MQMLERGPEGRVPVVRIGTVATYIDDLECYAGPHGQCLLKPKGQTAMEYIAECYLGRKLTAMERAIALDRNTWNLSIENVCVVQRRLGEGPTKFRQRCFAIQDEYARNHRKC